MAYPAPVTMKVNICKLPRCNRPCFVDPTGVAFDYCGRSHAQEDQPRREQEKSSTTCQLPGCHAPVFREAGKAHQYCNRTHAIQGIPHMAGSSRSIRGGRCQYPNCDNPRYVDEDGQALDFCSRRHANAFCYYQEREEDVLCAYEGCKRKRYSEGANVYDYCGKTHATQARQLLLAAGKCVTCRSAPAIPPVKYYMHCPPCWMKNMGTFQQVHHERDLHVGFLAHSSTTFNDLKEQFVRKWLHDPSSPPTVVDILVFLVPQKFRDRYYAKRNELEQKGGFLTAGHHEGNEKRRFHGTSQKCMLGRGGCCSPCRDPSCNVCNIIRNGFDKERVGASNRNYFGGAILGRFGGGMYFTATSSKSNSYNNGSIQTVGPVHTKSMFAAKVALGRGKKLLEDNYTLTAPPPGYDSVLGEVGKDLNHDECVVYDERQILPAYLIIYSE